MGWIRSNRSDDGPEGHADRLASIAPGVPGHCPACDGLGYIENIDLGHRYQIQHCKDCGHRWEYLFDRDGAVVGLTELDDRGQPRSRTRVRPLRASPGSPGTEAVEDAGTHADGVTEAAEGGGTAPEEAASDADDALIDLVEEPAGDASAREDEVIDLRAPVPVPPAEAATRPEDMSPGEWLRHLLGR